MRIARDRNDLEPVRIGRRAGSLQQAFEGRRAAPRSGRYAGRAAARRDGAPEAPPISAPRASPPARSAARNDARARSAGSVPGAASHARRMAGSTSQLASMLPAQTPSAQLSASATATEADPVKAVPCPSRPSAAICRCPRCGSTPVTSPTAVSAGAPSAMRASTSSRHSVEGAVPCDATSPAPSAPRITQPPNAERSGRRGGNPERLFFHHGQEAKRSWWIRETIFLNLS